MRQSLPIVLVSIFVVSVLVLIALYFFAKPANGTFELEIAKAVLQLGVVSVIGAAVAILVFEYQREGQRSDRDREHERERMEAAQDQERSRLQYREDLLKSTLAKAMASYNAVKKARRLLRARAIAIGTGSPEQWVTADAYDTYMDVINDAQLELENLARDVDTSRRAFSKADDLGRQLRSMEGFLGKLIKEYESSRRRFASETSRLSLSDLRTLEAFLGPSRNSAFLHELSRPYHEIQKAIREDLLHPQLPMANKDAKDS